jgi:hypothetical protein
MSRDGDEREPTWVGDQESNSPAGCCQSFTSREVLAPAF